MKISCEKFVNNNCILGKLPPGTMVKLGYPYNKYIFIVPKSEQSRGVFIDPVGRIWGAEESLYKAIYYNYTDYEIVGVFKADFNE